MNEQATPVESTPQETPPPVETPVVEAPPAETPPAEVAPPVETPPAETPPAETPPVEAAPAEETPPTDRVVPKPQDYKVPEGTPEGIRIFAHENGMTQEQLDASLAMYNVASEKAQEHHRNELINEGRIFLKAWGKDAQYKVTLAKKALEQNDPDGEVTELLASSGFGSHPAVIKFLHRIGHSMKEGGYIKSAVNRPPGKKTAAQAMYGDSHPSKEGE